MEEALGAQAAEWWSGPDFWEDMFDFIFPPEQLALGEEVAEKAAALLDLAPGASVLDLGCGPGRVSIPLARLGYRVVGVDLQPGYLARARARAMREGVEVTLRRADVSALEIDRAFDAALSVFTSFGSFAERSLDERILRSAWRALRPGGRFLLETAHRDGVVRLMRAEVTESSDGRRWRSEPTFDPVSGVLEARWTLTTAAGTRVFTSRMRPYSASELGEMFRETGFRDVRFLGDLDGGPPSLDSYTIVVVGSR